MALIGLVGVVVGIVELGLVTAAVCAAVLGVGALLIWRNLQLQVTKEAGRAFRNFVWILIIAWCLLSLIGALGG